MHIPQVRFADPDREDRYRAHYLKQDKRQAQIVIAAILVATILYVSSDIIFAQSGQELMSLLLLRLGFAFWSLSIILLLQRASGAKAFDAYAAAWLVSLIALMVFIYSTRPAANLNGTLTTCLVVLLFYVLFPTRFSLQLFAALLLSAADLNQLYMHQQELQQGALRTVTTSYSIFNLMGIYIALRWHKQRRREFSTYLKNRSLREKLEALAYTDELTGLANRRASLKRMASEFRRYKRYHHPLSIMMIDIDRFKTVNDNYGHDQGDGVLKSVAGLLDHGCRDEDMAGRLGGEEFLILLPETNLQQAQLLAERLRQRCEQNQISVGEVDICVTISIGVAQASHLDQSAKGMLKRADVALYNAKREGRNCVLTG